VQLMPSTLKVTVLVSARVSVMVEVSSVLTVCEATCTNLGLLGLSERPQDLGAETISSSLQDRLPAERVRPRIPSTSRSWRKACSMSPLLARGDSTLEGRISEMSTRAPEEVVTMASGKASRVCFRFLASWSPSDTREHSVNVPATQEAVVVRVEVAVFWMEVVRVSSTMRKFDLPSLSWPCSRPDSTNSSISLSISVSL